MKTQTAVNVIQTEAKFLGMSFVDLMKDVKNNGVMLYSPRVVQAVSVVVNN